MKNIFLEISRIVLFFLFINCSDANKSNPSIQLNSVHNIKNDSSAGAYQKNQDGIINGKLIDKNSSPLGFLREEILENYDIIYTDKSSPEFSTNECLYLYIKKESNDYKLFLKIRYVGEEWIDLQNVLFTLDDNVDYTFNGISEKTVTKGKKVSKIEFFEKEINTNKEIEIFESISKAKNVLVLLVGEKSYKKRILTHEQQIAMINILNAYYYFNKNKS